MVNSSFYLLSRGIEAAPVGHVQVFGRQFEGHLKTVWQIRVSAHGEQKNSFPRKFPPKAFLHRHQICEAVKEGFQQAAHGIPVHRRGKHNDRVRQHLLHHPRKRILRPIVILIAVRPNRIIKQVKQRMRCILEYFVQQLSGITVFSGTGQQDERFLVGHGFQPMKRLSR
ncbi:hypothetical protein FHS90_003304 [Rufibacter quisquiliarum]|uniref:Uncharacterized protein n=1 Tax=Rufibacter quisquiliarum TaxID=1549639 RepID=A0A839GFY9_9BACT|nr:hypothetical protein [Rufibacter quisquiliarum]